jgi:hypothetical protein
VNPQMMFSSLPKRQPLIPYEEGSPVWVVVKGRSLVFEGYIQAVDRTSVVVSITTEGVREDKVFARARCLFFPFSWLKMYFGKAPKVPEQGTLDPLEDDLPESKTTVNVGGILPLDEDDEWGTI